MLCRQVYNEMEMLDDGRFMTPKEHLAFRQWMFNRWNTQLSAFKQSSDKTHGDAWNLQRCLIGLTMDLCEGLRREVIANLRVDSLHYRAGTKDHPERFYVVTDLEKRARNKTNEVPLPCM